MIPLLIALMALGLAVFFELVLDWTLVAIALFAVALFVTIAETGRAWLEMETPEDEE
jgi:hypothetical protein